MSQSKTETVKKKLTVMQSIATGSIAGATEVLVNHPLWSIKTRLQAGESFTIKPSVVYRGIVPNALSMIPITATQVALTQGMQKLFFKEKFDLSNVQKIACAFAGGVGSAFIGCPTEMVMTYQSKSKEKISFKMAYKDIISKANYPALYRGLIATMVRDGFFSTFFLAGVPIIKAQIKPYCTNDYYASFFAGISAGVVATGASQWVDTIKTVQQSSALSQPNSIKDAIKKIYTTDGVYGFFKGSIPRGGRVVSAVTLMGFVNEQLEQYFTKK